MVEQFSIVGLLTALERGSPISNHAIDTAVVRQAITNRSCQIGANNAPTAQLKRYNAYGI